jgi:D-glycerate 3-kinase
VAVRWAELRRPCVVGLCGPQGSGKSTAAEAMRLRLRALGLKAAVVSLDDFYLTRAERVRLAAEVHPLLATRGPPGTHDVGLAERVIGALLAGEDVALPSFDKAMDERRPAEQWPVFEGPADVVLFEGWCVGARPQRAAALRRPVNSLERDEDPHCVWRGYVNTALDRYQPLFARLDPLILLQPPGFEVVARWRREQEATLRAQVGERPGLRMMSDAEIDRFVQHYERVSRQIMREAPARADVVVCLGPRRELRRLVMR